MQAERIFPIFFVVFLVIWRSGTKKAHPAKKIRMGGDEQRAGLTTFSDMQSSRGSKLSFQSTRLSSGSTFSAGSTFSSGIQLS